VTSSSSSTPILTCELVSKRRDDGVVGLTLLGNLIFILRSPNTQEIDVYDIQARCQLTPLHVEELSDDGDGAHGLASCVTNNCLYVSHRRKDTVYKIELASNHRVHSWPVGKWPEELSVNAACNILVACFEACKIQEFTTNGMLIRDVSLTSTLGQLHPYHMVQLTNGNLVISGCIQTRSYECDVIELDAAGNFLVSYSEKDALRATRIRKFAHPSHLAVDKNDKYILVADCGNDRILILDRSMKSDAREFNAPVQLTNPWSLTYDEPGKRLHVGEANWEIYSRVLMFDNVVVGC
jgi:hypothetical protein